MNYAKLAAVRDKVEQDYLGKGGNAHSFSIGKDDEGRDAIIVHVDSKLPVAQLSRDAVIPKAYSVEGEEVPVKIKERSQPKVMRLMVGDADAYARSASPHAGIADWQKCHDCPIPGGVQIAPAGAGWVGTLSAAVQGLNADGELIPGALTNYHVAVMGAGTRGHQIGQPSGGSGHWFAKLDRFHPIQFSQNASNLVDGAFLDARRSDGPYAPGTYTVKPEQLNLGKIVPNPVLLNEQKVGDTVTKSGRTTGVTTGRVVGIGATTHVGYDQGTARFVNQIIVEGDAGEFSQPGDSGSLVLLRSSLRPYALLFAGGGGTTIVNPIEYVINAFGLKFFAQ